MEVMAALGYSVYQEEKEEEEEEENILDCSNVFTCRIITNLFHKTGSCVQFNKGI